MKRVAFAWRILCGDGYQASRQFPAYSRSIIVDFCALQRLGDLDGRVEFTLVYGRNSHVSLQVQLAVLQTSNLLNKKCSEAEMTGSLLLP